MLSTARSFRGMFTAPHHLAAQSGLAVLREGDRPERLPGALEHRVLRDPARGGGDRVGGVQGHRRPHHHPALGRPQAGDAAVERGARVGGVRVDRDRLAAREEGRLQDPRLRENFVERVFAYRRLRDQLLARLKSRFGASSGPTV